jgi:hypothetical protein
VIAVGGARRIRTQRRFSTLAQSFCSHFPAKSHDFGGIALRFSQDAPENAPRINWLPRNPPGRRWTTKSYSWTGFLGVFRDFWTSLDVAGSLWSWDGWPPNSQPKYLFLQPFYFSASADAPRVPPARNGCYRTSLDGESRHAIAPRRSSQSCKAGKRETLCFH